MSGTACEHCKFFKPVEAEDAPEIGAAAPAIGACRRYAPFRLVNDTEWPVVAAADWCGEFAPKAQAS